MSDLTGAYPAAPGNRRVEPARESGAVPAFLLRRSRAHRIPGRFSPTGPFDRWNS